MKKEGRKKKERRRKKERRKIKKERKEEYCKTRGFHLFEKEEEESLFIHTFDAYFIVFFLSFSFFFFSPGKNERKEREREKTEENEKRRGLSSSPNHETFSFPKT